MSAADEPSYVYLHVDVTPEDSELVSARLWELGAEGLEERDATTLSRPDREGAEMTLVAHFASEEQAEQARAQFEPRHHARVRYVVGDAWRDTWRMFFKPTRIGARLVVRPSWESVTLQPNEIAVTVDPGRAFGSGTHETTRLVLRELDRRIHGGERVLDAGCGSGILGVAAVLLGARSVRAVDVDEDAIAVTRENAQLNHVNSRVRASTTAITALRGAYDVVLANIEARVLVPMSRAIVARVAHDGWLVLSGVLAHEWKEVREAYATMESCLVVRDGEWVALVLRRVPTEQTARSNGAALSR